MSVLKLDRSITLIGMAGVGKSTMGKVLADKLSLSFQDTDDDVLIRLGTNTMFDYMLTHDEKQFLEIEEEVLQDISPNPDRIIATGGSVIYSKNVMDKLASFSILIYLTDHIDRIIERTEGDDPRGTVFFDAPDLTTLYQQRDPLYRRYADIVFHLPDAFDKSLIADKIIQEIKSYMSSNDKIV